MLIPSGVALKLPRTRSSAGFQTPWVPDAQIPGRRAASRTRTSTFNSSSTASVRSSWSAWSPTPASSPPDASGWNSAITSRWQCNLSPPEPRGLAFRRCASPWPSAWPRCEFAASCLIYAGIISARMGWRQTIKSARIDGKMGVWKPLLGYRPGNCAAAGGGELGAACARATGG
jgi:hypothetical protein